MDGNIYMMADFEICRRIGRKVKALRLRQNITQTSLAEQTQISVSTVKKIENGEIGSFDSLLRVFRILGELDIFSPLMKEMEMSPNEILKFVEETKKKQRRRANSENNPPLSNNQEESEW